MAGARNPAILLGLALGAAACAEETGASDEFVVVTSITVDPALFLGSVPCSSDAGAMRSYVATISDFTEEGRHFTLPSSPPVSCAERVSFRNVVPGHVYVAEIDGYTDLPNELEPIGGPSSGSRALRRVSGGPAEQVAPRWEGGCRGNPTTGGAVAATRVNVTIGECELVDNGPASVTGIRVDPASALGALTCGGKPGQVSAVDVLPVGSGLPALLGVGCASAAPTYDAGVVAGETYEFRLEADVDGVAYGARCSAEARESVTTTASCNLLSRTGSLEVPLADVLAQAQKACDTDVDAFDVSIEALLGDPPVLTVVDSGVVACDAALGVAPLEPAKYWVRLEGHMIEGGSPLSASCVGMVVAGDKAEASCSLVP